MPDMKIKLGISNGINVGVLGTRKGGGAAADTTAPSVSTFTVTTPSTSRDVAITAFTASEAGVSFIITESSTPPLAGAAGWVGSAPATWTVSADGSITLYPWVKDAAGNVSSAFGSPRTVVVLALPFTDNFTRADGAIGGVWSGATWTISSNAVLNTPTLTGSELITNGGFEGTYENEGSQLDLAPNWDNFNADAGSDTLAESATAHGGSKSQQINVNANAEGIKTAGTPLASLGWYQCSVYVTITNGTLTISDDDGTSINNPISTQGTWDLLVATGRTVSTNRKIYIYATDGAANALVDDASAKAISLPSMFATLPDVGVANVTIQAILPVRPTGHHAGLVVNLNSASSPTSFVYAELIFINGGMSARLTKVVSGTYTNLINTNVTYNAASNLKLVKSGDTYSLWYGAPGSETQVGTDQTIASMNGTIHGMFSSYSQPRLDTFQLSVTP